MLIRTIRNGEAGRWPLRATAVAIIVACMASLGRAAEPVRLALIGDASLPTVRSFQAILEAELAGLPGAVLLERSEIQRVIAEQKLTGLFDAEQAIRVGRLLPADVFVWIDCRLKAEHPDGLVIYDAHTGVRYVDGMGSFDCSLLMADPPRQRVLVSIGGKDAMAPHNGLWAIDTRTLAMQRVLACDGPTIFGRIIAIEPDRFTLAYRDAQRSGPIRFDLRTDQCERFFDRTYMNNAPVTLPFHVLGDFGWSCLPINGELWTTDGWRRLLAGDEVPHALPRLKHPSGEGSIEPFSGHSFQFAQKGTVLILQEYRTIWAIRFDKPVDTRLPASLTK